MVTQMGLKKLAMVLFISVVAFPSFGGEPQKWFQEQKINTNVFTINEGGYGFAELLVDKESCEEEVLLSFSSESIMMYAMKTNAELEILTINDTNVNVTYYGKNKLDVYFYSAKSAKGKDYILNQFATKRKVSVSLPNGETNVFSTSGFSKSRASIISECKKRKELKANAL